MAWHVVHIKARQEERVVSQLSSAGLDVFLPKIEVRQKRRGCGVGVIEPLFPGYVFFSAGLTGEVWNAVRWTRGVKAILGCDGIPSSVSDESIVLIKQHIGPAGVIQPGESLFTLGDRVRVTDGPFAGLTGILERPPSRLGRVRVLLELLRGAVIELEDVDLELAS